MDFFFNPRTVAVVGASPTEGKISNIILKSLLAAGFAGRVFPVNPRYGSVEGLRCYPSLSSIGEAVDIAVFAVPAEGIPGMLKDTGGLLRGAIVISGGFAESGARGQALEKALKETAKKEGIRIIGPNCMGIYDTVSRLDTFFIPRDRMKRPPGGGLSVITQSGSFAVTAVDELAAEGIGVARVVSYGNKADVDESDCLEFLMGDDSTKAVAIYTESIGEGRRFVEAASRCSAKKPVMAIKVGRTDAAARAARSHTGAMAGRYEVYRAAFRKAGVIELRGYEDFLAGCTVFGIEKLAAGKAGKRVMVITDGGGMGVSIADSCTELGLEVAPIPEELRVELTPLFPSYFTLSNPMDLTGSVTDELFAEALLQTMSGDNYDMAIVCALWGPPALSDRLVDLLKEAARASGKPVIVCSPGGEYTRKRIGLFRAAGFPVFTTPEASARAAALLARTR